MTAVVFKFVHPDGTPVADAPFFVSLRKTSFDEKLDVGILLPGDVQGITDAQGSATLELVSGFGTYYLTMSGVGEGLDSDGCMVGLRYRFVVPESATPLRIEDIIITTPTFSRPWDEVALRVIVDAKATSQAAAISARNSADEAALSAAGTEEYAQRAETAAAQADSSKNTAVTAANTSVSAKDLASGFKDQAEASKNAAAGSATAANDSKNAAGASATSALNSANSAGNSALTATNKANQTAADAIATAADRVAVSADRVVVHQDQLATKGYRNEAEVFRNEAQAAVGTITGVISDGGGVDLSTGVYPAKPQISTVWRVTAAGVVNTIDYNIGDQLFYTKPGDYFYKVDSTDYVTSVQGRKGAVVVDKTDVGLSNVDNTADLAKPISNATKAELDKINNKTLKIAVVGDSYSQPSVRNNDWATQMCDLIEKLTDTPVQLRNVAINGSDFAGALTVKQHEGGTKSQVEEAIAFGPDMVFVALGINDTIYGNGYSQAQVIANAQAVFTALRAGLPNAKLIYCEEAPHDLTLGLVPAALTNENVVPFSHRALTYKGFSNLRINNAAYLQTALAPAKLTQHKTWGGASTAIRAMGDGFFSANIWKMSRMGCLSDLVHTTELGHTYWAWQAITYLATAPIAISKVNFAKLNIAQLTTGQGMNIDAAYTEQINRTVAGAMAGNYMGIDTYENLNGWPLWTPRARMVCETAISSATQNVSVYLENCRPDAAIWYALDGGAFINSGRTVNRDGSHLVTFYPSMDANLAGLRTGGSHILRIATVSATLTEVDAFERTIAVAADWTSSSVVVSPGYIEGLNWSCTEDNLIVVESGAATCPYSFGNVLVVLPAPITVNITTQNPGTTRVHLWLQRDDGTPRISADIAPLTLAQNYFGSAFKHPTQDGWRYIGTVQLDTSRNPLRQRSVRGNVKYLGNVNGDPHIVINGPGTTTVRNFNYDSVAPVTCTSINMLVFSNAASTRFAPQAPAAGFTVSGSLFTNATTATTNAFEIGVENARTVQFVSISDGGTILALINGYTYKR